MLPYYALKAIDHIHLAAIFLWHHAQGGKRKYCTAVFQIATPITLAIWQTVITLLLHTCWATEKTIVKIWWDITIHAVFQYKTFPYQICCSTLKEGPLSLQIFAIHHLCSCWSTGKRWCGNYLSDSLCFIRLATWNTEAKHYHSIQASHPARDGGRKWKCGYGPLFDIMGISQTWPSCQEEDGSIPLFGLARILDTSGNSTTLAQNQEVAVLLTLFLG